VLLPIIPEKNEDEKLVPGVDLFLNICRNTVRSVQLSQPIELL
jgi:hypothetical protein